MLSAAFSRWSSASRSSARPMPRVQLQQAELQRDDPDQRERDQRDPRAPADQAVEQAVALERRRAPASRPSATPRSARACATRRAGRRRRAGPETRRGRAERARTARRRGAPRGGPPARRQRRRAGSSRASTSSVSFRAARRRAEAARGLRASSSADGTIERRAQQRRLRLATAAADGQVGRADAAAGALGEEALDAPVLERVEGDAGEHAALAQQPPGERQRAVELSELVVDGDPQRLEGALGGMPAGEARGRGDRRR